ncbi:hypothetical protein [uncultured Roseovarius sp.]|uniref:hypothetical protein n=1 Tax=uncultured Roseovarius sp. TaxID=293344 RepID=UPI002631BFB7|nr:hypothetical protein [uncultured Roseovarius sp.]
MRSTIIAAIATLSMLMQPALAGTPVPAELDPINHTKATLIIVSHDGSETSYTPSELEKFATYSLTTKTPWREEPAKFEGVLLSEILSAHGLDRAASILVTAENDYKTTMSQELINSVDILVATRVDGRAHSRRARGPIQFVIDAETFATSSLTSESNFVWMAARIEAGN